MSPAHSKRCVALVKSLRKPIITPVVGGKLNKWCVFGGRTQSFHSLEAAQRHAAEGFVRRAAALGETGVWRTNPFLVENTAFNQKAPW